MIKWRTGMADIGPHYLSHRPEAADDLHGILFFGPADLSEVRRILAANPSAAKETRTNMLLYPLHVALSFYEAKPSLNDDAVGCSEDEDKDDDAHLDTQLVVRHAPEVITAVLDAYPAAARVEVNYYGTARFALSLSFKSLSVDAARRSDHHHPSTITAVLAAHPQAALSTDKEGKRHAYGDRYALLSLIRHWQHHLFTGTEGVQANSK